MVVATDQGATTHRYVQPCPKRTTLVLLMSILRSIEKRIRRLTLALLSGEGSITPDDPVRETLPEHARVLVVRIDRIGDAIVSTPILKTLHNHFPHWTIDILLGEKNRGIAPLLPYINRAIILENKGGKFLKTVRDLRRNNYDIVFNLHLNRSASASLVSRLAKGHLTLEHSGLEPFSQNQHTTGAGSHAHVVTTTSRVLARIGVTPLETSRQNEWPLELVVPDESARRAQKIEEELFADTTSKTRVFLNVSASHISRSWPPNRFGELAAGLQREGLVPVLCGAPPDAATLAEIACGMEEPALILPPVDSYSDFAAGLNLADLVVTGDTSTVHLAAAMNKPTIVLYSSEETAKAWNPWGVAHTILANPEGVDKINSDDVLSAVLELNRTRQNIEAGISKSSL